MSRNHSKIGKGLSLSPVAARPSDPENGDLIYNSTNTQFERYENGAWTSFSASSLKRFSAYCTTGQALANNTFTALICNQELYDSHNLHNTSTGEITADATCVMSFKIAVLSSNHTPIGAWNFGIEILKNGTAVKSHVENFTTTLTSTYPLNIAMDVPCVNGDVLIVRVYRSSSATFGIYATSDSAYTYIDCVVT